LFAVGCRYIKCANQEGDTNITFFSSEIKTSEGSDIKMWRKEKR